MAQSSNARVSGGAGGLAQFTVIHPTAKLGANVTFGEFCEVRADCQIGDNTRFGSRCTLAAGTIVGKNCELKYGFVATDTPKVGQKERTPCVIGDNVKTGANVTIMPGVRVGNNVTIGAGSTVRHDIPDNETWWGNPAGPNGCMVQDGIKFVDGKMVKSEGGVKVHPSVIFKAPVTVKRGLYKDTYTEIGENTVVNSFSNIGHNVKIGKDCIISSHVAICGGVEMGDHCYIGTNVTIIQDHKIGSWVKIRSGEVVDFDVPSYTYVGKNGLMKPNNNAPWYLVCGNHQPYNPEAIRKVNEGKCRFCDLKAVVAVCG